MASKTVSIPVLEKPVETGKALRIVTAPPPESSVKKPVWNYIPLSCIWEIHPNSVVMDEWIAKRKGLING